MTTLPANASIAARLSKNFTGEFDGANDVDSTLEGDLETVPAATNARAGKRDFVAAIGGDGRLATKVLATGALLAGGINAGVKPAMEAAGAENRIVQALAGVEPRPEISFTKKAGTPAQSHTEMLSATGAAEVGDENGRVPTRGR